MEVAETGSQFTPDEHFVHDNGVPTRGNHFITDGYVYQPGHVDVRRRDVRRRRLRRRGQPVAGVPRQR